MRGNADNPIYIDSDSDGDCMVIPDFPEPTQIKKELVDEKAMDYFNDAISEMSTFSSSESLSVCSGVGRMTIRLDGILNAITFSL